MRIEVCVEFPILRIEVVYSSIKLVETPIRNLDVSPVVDRVDEAYNPDIGLAMLDKNSAGYSIDKDWG